MSEQSASGSEISAQQRAVGPDVLRALAILLVMIVHLPLEATPVWLESIHSYGWIGVDIFFTLSGFLIGSQLLKEFARSGYIDLKRFYLRRAFRIFPAYFIVLLIVLFIPAFQDAAKLNPIWKFITFTANFDLNPAGSFTQAWTLSVEEQFYLALPLSILFLGNRLSIQRALGIVAAVVFAGAFLRFTVWSDEVGPLLEVGKFRSAFGIYLREVYYPTYMRLDGLVFGILLAAVRIFAADLWKRYIPPHISLSIGTSLVLAAFATFSLRGSIIVLQLPSIFQARVGAVAGFPLVSLGIAFLLGGMLDLDRKFRRYPVPGAALVATLSYSLYLTHKSIYHFDNVVFGGGNLRGTHGFLLYLSTTFFVSYILWFCIERNFLHLRRRYYDISYESITPICRAGCKN